MTSKRSTPAQQAPGPDLTGFPVATGLPTTWYREHQDRPASPDRGCWWFSSRAPHTEPGGRFDLTSPHGTCYLGETVGVAVRERVGRFLAHRLPIPSGHIRGRAVSTVTLDPLPENPADLTSPAAATHGVTGELATTSDYPLTAAWAQALFDHDHDALLYQPRFTPGQERALALFGAASTPQTNPHAARPVADTIDLDDALAALGYPATRSTIPSTSAMAADDNTEPEDA